MNKRTWKSFRINKTPIYSSKFSYGDAGKIDPRCEFKFLDNTEETLTIFPGYGIMMLIERKLASVFYITFDPYDKTNTCKEDFYKMLSMRREYEGIVAKLTKTYTNGENVSFTNIMSNIDPNIKLKLDKLRKGYDNIFSKLNNLRAKMLWVNYVNANKDKHPSFKFKSTNCERYSYFNPKFNIRDDVEKVSACVKFILKLVKEKPAPNHESSLRRVKYITILEKYIPHLVDQWYTMAWYLEGERYNFRHRMSGPKREFRIKLSKLKKKVNGTLKIINGAASKLLKDISCAVDKEGSFTVSLIRSDIIDGRPVSEVKSAVTVNFSNKIHGMRVGLNHAVEGIFNSLNEREYPKYTSKDVFKVDNYYPLFLFISLAHKLCKDGMLSETINIDNYIVKSGSSLAGLIESDRKTTHTINVNSFFKVTKVVRL